MRHVCVHSGIGLAANHAIWQQPPCFLRMLGLNCFFIAFVLLFAPHTISTFTANQQHNKSLAEITHSTEKRRKSACYISQRKPTGHTVCHGAQHSIAL